MKKFFCSYLVLVFLFILSGCGASKGKIIISKTTNITKISINTQPGNDSSLRSTEDKSKIKEIISYINNLDLKKTTKDVSKYNGMSYIITVYFDDKASTEFLYLGNMFFKESGSEWHEVSYNQAEKFESIYKGLGSK